MYSYHETRKEIVRLKNEILHGRSSDDENVGGGRSNLPGDPTGRTAVLMVSHRRIEQLERIADAIETVIAQLPEQKKRLLKYRYWDKPRKLTWDGIAMELHVSTRQAMRWRDEIVFAVAEKIGWR